MIELYQFRPKFSVPNLSPFCLKLETWLKMADLPYTVKYLDDPRKAPLGKLPFIKEGSLVLADSSVIIEHLTQHHKIKLDSHLSAYQSAQAHAVQVMIEEHLYWALVYHRWLGESWPQLKAAVFGSLPPVAKQLVPILIQRKLRADLNSQGLGRHSPEQINQMAEADLRSMSVLLGENTYFLGEKLSSVDSVVFAILCEIYHSSLITPLTAIAERFDNLSAYHLRVGKQFFPDYYA